MATFRSGFALPGGVVYQRLMQSRPGRAALALLLAAGSAAVHAGALGHGFVNFDDGVSRGVTTAAYPSGTQRRGNEASRDASALECREISDSPH